MLNYQDHKVDLSNCDNEPIHLIGRIQPHGFLLVLHRETFAIEQASDNVTDFLKIDAWAELGQLATASEYLELLEFLRQDTPEASVRIISLQGTPFYAFLHKADPHLILEFEPVGTTGNQGEQLIPLQGYTLLAKSLDQPGSLAEKAELTVAYVQQVLGYDHVMLYKFDEDWHGEVIGEKVKPGFQSYLHHHFPATDIPAQARELLVQKPVRQIAHVGAEAVNISPYLNPSTGKPAHLFRSELRNPSEIHLEYLQNMGVQATLSISIVVRGKLWGIIACHHRTPLFISYWKRLYALQAAQAFGSCVMAHQEHRDLQQLARMRELEEEMMERLQASDDLLTELGRQRDALLGLTEASGMALYLGGELHLAGTTPPKPELDELVNWLSLHMKDNVLHSKELSKVYPGAEALQETASGLLAVEISKLNKEYLLYFKPEISEKRIWAGDPDKAVQKGSSRIHPRKSFKQWSEMIRGKSLPWSLNELDIAQSTVKSLISVVLRNQKKHLQELNDRLQQAADLLQSKNRRLEDFTYIIAHNLRSPLANMQGLSEMYYAEPETGGELMGMMDTVIQNMRGTLDDLNVILKSELQQPNFDEVYLPDVVEKELQNLQAVLLETNAIITTSYEVEKLALPHVYLESIAHNLISNALKYRSPERQPEIKIKSWLNENRVCFSVTDNGQGLDLGKHGQKLFQPYKTFHENKDAKGLGLYLTRVQAEALGGFIKVESTPDKSTTFTVCFGVLPA